VIAVSKIKLLLIIQGFLISVSSLFTPKVLANPVPISSLMLEEKSANLCEKVVPKLNSIAPTESSLPEDQVLPTPTSACAPDLKILSATPNTAVLLAQLMR
jgi:hypothetical protein